MQEQTIRVAILSPTLAIRVGLRALLETDDGIDVIAEFVDFDTLSDQSDEIDVLVASLGGESLAEWPGTLTGSRQPISLLFLTDSPQDLHTIVGLPVQAWGILSIDASEDELIAAVRALYFGMHVAPPEFLEPMLLTYSFGDAEELIEELTPRESEVLALLAQGLANKQIAAELNISEHTVKFHISAIYRKFGVTNRTEAVRMGMRLGLVLL